MTSVYRVEREKATENFDLSSKDCAGTLTALFWKTEAPCDSDVKKIQKSTCQGIGRWIFQFISRAAALAAVRPIIRYALSEGVTEGKLLRLLPSLPSGIDLRYSVSPRWAMPTPMIPP